MIKLNVLTPVHKGGPCGWGHELVRMINGRYSSDISAHQTYSYDRLLLTPIYQSDDIIHTAVPLTYRLYRKPVVLTVKGDYTIESPLWRRLYPASARMADVITTPSLYLKRRLGLDSAIVIPNAIDSTKYAQVSHVDKDTVNLLTVTKFLFQDKAESVLELVKIFDEVRRSSDRKMRYTIVGGGPYLDAVKKKAMDISPDVTFAGFSNDVQSIMASSDAFIYYSSHDNFPNVILEAMASGLPVMTNDVGAVGEIIDDKISGYIAENGGYVDRLKAIVGDAALRAKLGAAGRRAVEEKFEWSRVVGQYVAIYRDIAR